MGHQYLVCMQYAVMTCLGGELMPRDTLQTIVSFIGLFLGAVINANIFGELAVIFGQLDKSEQEADSQMSAINTAMINLDLTLKTQVAVRDEVFRNKPTLKFQITMKDFLEYISPSLQYKVIDVLFTKLL